MGAAGACAQPWPTCHPHRSFTPHACAGLPSGPSKPLGTHLSTHQGLRHVVASPKQRHAHQKQQAEDEDPCAAVPHWVDAFLPALNLVPESTGVTTKEMVAVRPDTCCMLVCCVLAHLVPALCAPGLLCCACTQHMLYENCALGHAHPDSWSPWVPSDLHASGVSLSVASAMTC